MQIILPEKRTYTITLCLLLIFTIPVKAQQSFGNTVNEESIAASDTIPAKSPQPMDAGDTFFLAKKKGLLGKLGKSITTDPPGPEPVKVANPYLKYAGKTIRTIELLSLGFERNINDTSRIKKNFGIRVGNALHKNTAAKIIHNNLLFNEGDKLFPYVLADNERLLRDQVYIQDARIIVEMVPGTTDSVDVLVITKDVFSIGGSASISGDRARVELREENFGGRGSLVSISTLYDQNRKPTFGYGAAFTKRNIRGSFIDWSVGFQTYHNAFNSGRNEETYLYTHFEKPLVSPYIPWTGALDIAFNKTSNAYLGDSLYKNDFKYGFFNTDLWFGYNFGSKRFLYKNISTRLRKFIAIRGLHQHFNQVPDRSRIAYDYRYANITGALAAISVFKQNFYRTSFIYGFGRNEDVPEGFSASVIGGWTNKEGRKRPYYGAEGQLSHFSKKGFYSTYTLRFGGYSYQNHTEDVDLLLNIDHFTRLKKISTYWFNRFFWGTGFTKQFNPLLNQPLYLQSNFGLPYFSNGATEANFRATLKTEAVFFHMKKFIGFRLAPFAFFDMSLLTPSGKGISKSDGYTAFGGGLRARNENLVFGTLELKGYIFPRTMANTGMKGWKIEFSSNIRFKYSSVFIRKPDFVIPN